MDNTTNNLALDCNIIDQYKVSKLLDGRYFFIPSYQRGYRWGKQQIYDLCNDLLEYCIKVQRDIDNTQTGDASFYSLQPLIVRKGTYNINGQDQEAYEVIDGQQRLTTIFIMYRFLVAKLNYLSLEAASRDMSNKKLYHLFYQTRPTDYNILEKLGFEDIKGAEIQDIDIAHVVNAYLSMEKWLYSSPEEDPDGAAATFNLFSNKEFSAKSVKDMLLALLNDTCVKGSVQFIWYELNESKDAIKEFLSENKGKIQLTDTEKIKALFLQRSNFGKDIKNLKQLSIAKDWELIENTLHRNDFWSFISKDIDLEDGRINIIFKYIYEKSTTSVSQSDTGDTLFRYYYKLFAQNRRAGDDNASSELTDKLWSEVMDCYRMLLNWYNNPKIYNLVGLLIKHNYSIKKISDIYDDESVITNDDFCYELNKEIRKEIVDKIPIAKENSVLDIKADEEYINLFFNKSTDKEKMHDLFRFINVREINKTIDKALTEIDKDEDEKKRSDIKRSSRDVLSHIYRFPFEALDVFGWDIEHIDSATTNSLTDPKAQQEWVNEAEATIGEILLEDENYKALKEAYSSENNHDKNGTLNSMVKRIQSIVDEDEDVMRKNWIGNLTLLDQGTNRSYQNKIYAWKCKVIHKRIQSGVFVPICTQNIFTKGYSGCTQTRWKWSHEDKKAYHAYILNELKLFQQEFPDNADSQGLGSQNEE